MSASDRSISSIPRLSQPIYFRRRIQLQADQGYGIGRTGLMRRWTILTPNILGRLNINGIPVRLLILDGRNFDLKAIREALREALDNQSQLADNTLFGTQLLATEYYRSLPTTCLFDHIFTGDLCVTFDLETSSDDPVPEKVEIEEEYALSDTQIQERLRSGESLEDIRRDGEQTVGQTF